MVLSLLSLAGCRGDDDSWTPWYSLNTITEITDALQNLPDDADTYELRYDDGIGTKVTRTIEVKDCTALGVSDPRVVG